MSDDLLVSRLKAQCAEAQLADARAELLEAEIRETGGQGPVVNTTLTEFLRSLLPGRPSAAELQALQALRPTSNRAGRFI